MILDEYPEALARINEQDHEGVYNLSEDLIASPEHKKAALTLLDFDGLLDPPLKIHEDLKPGCGGKTWPAGMVLAKYLLRKDVEELQNETMYVQSVASLRSRLLLTLEKH